MWYKDNKTLQMALLVLVPASLWGLVIYQPIPDLLIALALSAILIAPLAYYGFKSYVVVRDGQHRTPSTEK